MPANPYEPPKRRWYQFKLSTILVLVAILAWGMSMRPEVRPRFNSMTRTVSPSSEEQGSVATHITVGERAYICYFHVESRQTRYIVDIGIMPPAIVWPALALLAFLAWKWASSRVARWRTGTSRVDGVGVAKCETAKSRPRWLRFGLRSMFVVAALAATVVAFWLWHSRRHERELRAVAAIQNEQGWAIVCWKQSVPDWVVLLLGDGLSEAFETVDEVGFPRAPKDSSPSERPGTSYGLVDHELEPLMLHLAALPNLRTLQLDGTNITDESLERIDRLVSLERVQLRGTRVTDEGVSALMAKMRRLRVED